jgi:hypothetical protein
MTKQRAILSAVGVLAALALSSAVQADTAASAQSGATLDKSKLMEQASSVSADARAHTDAKLAAQAKKVDSAAKSSTDAGATVAARLSKEFGVSADVLASERQQFDTGWGQIMIAHSIAASATNGVTADQLLTMHKDGMGWGDIAAGLGLSMGKTVSATNADTQMALGHTKASSQMTKTGAGAQAGVSSATEAHAPATDASVHAGLGLGLGHR